MVLPIPVPIQQDRIIFPYSPTETTLCIVLTELIDVFNCRQRSTNCIPTTIFCLNPDASDRNRLWYSHYQN